jgi:16S rRNA (cytosine1402-N4)-methyltransferase
LTPKHIPVLTEEVIIALNLKANGIYIDSTLGEGGHTRQILESTDMPISVIGFEVDSSAIKSAAKVLQDYDTQVTIVNASYIDIPKEIIKLGLNKVDGVVFDLGLSSLQLGSSDRGFSFRSESPLDMRFNQAQEIDAWQIVNLSTEQELADMLKQLGEEPYARRISRSIVKSRPINTTRQLAKVIVQSSGRRIGKVHPATRSFQAIRMKVNDELNNIRKGLDQAISILPEGGRLVVISYHSIEDRIVKKYISEASTNCICDHKIIECVCSHKAYLKSINKKVIKPKPNEIELNPRSRSARLRVAEKLSDQNS